MDEINVLLIVSDTLRADHLGCYGYFRNTSPNIDCIAKEGVLFEDFYNAGAPTGPAFTSIYTGLYPIHHGHYSFIRPNIPQVDDIIFTMPEIMRALGYTTAAIDNLINFPSHSKHWVRGYDFYINPSRAFEQPTRILAENVNRRIIQWIKNYINEKFFLFVHYWDPHLRYTQPIEYQEMFHHSKGDLSDLEIKKSLDGYQYVPGWGKIGELAEGEIIHPFYGNIKKPIKISIDLYDGAIRYMDNAIGEIIAALKNNEILEETLIIITSDHGENLCQHFNPSTDPISKWWEHGSLHDTVTHIPFIIRYPKRLPRGIKVKGFCQHIDLLPTILDLISVRTNVLNIDGKSIIPLLTGEKIRDRIFMEHSNGQKAIRTEEWKFLTDEWADKWGILPNGPELFNVKQDPMETNNLANTKKEKVEELRKALHNWMNNSLNEEEKYPDLHKRGTAKNRTNYHKEVSNLLALLDINSNLLEGTSF